MKVIFSITGVAAVGIVAAMMATKPDSAEAGSAVFVGQRTVGSVSMDEVDHSE